MQMEKLKIAGVAIPIFDKIVFKAKTIVRETTQRRKPHHEKGTTPSRGYNQP